MSRLDEIEFKDLCQLKDHDIKWLTDRCRKLEKVKEAASNLLKLHWIPESGESKPMYINNVIEGKPKQELQEALKELGDDE